MSSDWYLIKGNNFFSGYESDQFGQLSPTVFDELLSVSPESYDVTVNGVSKKVIIQHEQDGNKRVLLSKIGDVLYGNLVVYDSKNWLVIDRPTNDKINDHSIIQLCNTTFPIQTGETQILKGYDSMNRPVYETTPVYTNLPCIASRQTYTIDNQQAINIIDGKLHIQLPYSTDFINNVKEGYQFTLANDTFNKYQVQGIDMTQTVDSSGVIQVFADKVV